MKFDNLKNIKPKNIKVDTADENYVNYLCSLPQDKPKKQIWTAVGTAAAAVIIILGVSFWAIIGRGIRGTHQVHEEFLTPAATNSESVEITDEMQEQFDLMMHQSHYFALPVFKRGELPSQKAILDYIYYIKTPAKSDWIITPSELNDITFDLFGVKSNFTSGTSYDSPYTINVSYAGQQLFSFIRSKLDDGTPIITLTYGEDDTSVTTLSYVPKSDFEPDYFIEHTIENTVYVKKTEKPFEEESIYKVKGDLADELLDIVRVASKSKDSDICYCAPTYKIGFNGIEYKVVTGGDKYKSHIVYKSGLEGTINHTLTDIEYQRLEKALEKCIVDKNFTEKKTLKYKTKDSEVKVSVDSDCEKYKEGIYTINGDDAKTLIRLLEEKSYVYDQAELATGVSIQIGKKQYTLNTDDMPFIQNSCGRYPLTDDTEIIPLIEKYIKPQFKNVIESEFQSLATKYCFEKMYDFDRGTIPDYYVAKYYIAAYYRQNQSKDTLDMYEGAEHRLIYGYPTDIYNKYMTELFGKSNLPDNVTLLKDVPWPKYNTIGIVKADDGSLFVPIETEGGLDYTYYFDSATEGKYNGQKTVTIEYRVTYGDILTDGGTQKRSVTYTTDDGINPKHFIEHKTIE